MPARVSTRMLAPLSYIIGACLALVPDTSIFGIRVARELDRLLVAYGKPKTIASDNGTELTSTPSCGGLMTTRSNGITSHRGSRYRTPSPNPSSAACAMSCSMRRCSIRYRTPAPRSMHEDPPSHASPRLRLQVGQRRRRYQNDPGLSWPQVDTAYGALHRAGADAVQKLIPGLTAPCSGFEIKKGDPSFSNSKKLKYLGH